MTPQMAAHAHTQRRAFAMAITLVAGAMAAAPFVRVAAAQSPGGVSTNLSAWFKADAGVTTGATFTWASQAPPVNSASQTTAGSQPTLNTTAVNFNPSLVFDGTSDFLTIATPTLPTGNIPYSVIAVARPNTLSGVDYLFVEGTAAVGQWVGVGANNATTLQSNFGAPLSVGALTAGAPFVLRYTRSAVGTRVNFRDGLQVATDVLASIIKLNSFQRIGNSNASEFWHGQIAELIVYQGAPLTATQYQRIESYLAIKYGITLNQSTAANYLDSAGTVIWGATANATYQNNITGIGRDDGSALVQRQSQSANAGSLVTIGLGTIAATEAANPHDFETDRIFEMWGDDGAATTFTVAMPGTSTPTWRMARVWNVQETGAVPTVLVRIPADTGGGIPIDLIVSNDATFDASDTVVAMSPVCVGDAIHLAAPFDFASGQFFTFARATPTTFDEVRE